MNRLKNVMLIAVSAAALTACSSAPVRYYTLQAPQNAQATGTAQAPYSLNIQPVGVPAQLDTSSLVIRSGATDVQVLDRERWSANFADEVRGALSQSLTTLLGSQDIAGLASTKQPVFNIKVQVRRFDVMPGTSVTLDAVWRIDAVNTVSSGQQAPLLCHSTLVATSADSEANAVAAAQKTIQDLAAQIAAHIRAESEQRLSGCAG